MIKPEKCKGSENLSNPPDLPVEIYLLILSFVTDPLDLYAVRQTSRSLYAQAEVVLYPRLELKSEPRGFGGHKRFFIHLAQSPKAAASVQALSVKLRYGHLAADISYIFKMVTALPNLIHYEIVAPHIRASQVAVEAPFPSQAPLRTLIIRNLRLPADICSLLEQQPLIETLVLETNRQGNNYLNQGLLRPHPNLLPRLKILACNATAASELLPGRAIVAYCCNNGLFASRLAKYPSVLSLHTTGDLGRDFVYVAGCFPNLRIVCLDQQQAHYDILKSWDKLECLQIMVPVGNAFAWDTSRISRLFDWCPKLLTVELILNNDLRLEARRFERDAQEFMPTEVLSWDAWMHV